MTTTDTGADAPLRHLSEREFAKLRLLELIAERNANGDTPCKADLTRGSRTPTRQARYTMVDTLLGRGLLRNASNVPGRYQLVVTAWGHQELDRHAQ